jgi:hypothetical protein
MKRLLILLACMSAFVGLVAGGASAGKSTFGYHLTLTPSAATLTTGETVGLSGDFTGWFNGYRHVTVSMYDNATCTGPAVDDWTVTTNSHGNYSVDPVTIDEAGVYGFKAMVTGFGFGYGTASGCASVTVTAPEEPVTPPVEPAAPDNGSSSYLCWNHEMVNPVAYFDSVADEMWMTGNYFEPQAVLGNVDGGTNIGAYHLVCNAVSTLSPTGWGLGGSGEVYAPAIMDAYHAIHSNFNDLNLYHIFG